MADLVLLDRERMQTLEINWRYWAPAVDGEFHENMVETTQCYLYWRVYELLFMPGKSYRSLLLDVLSAHQIVHVPLETFGEMWEEMAWALAPFVFHCVRNEKHYDTDRFSMDPYVNTCGQLEGFWLTLQ